MLRSELGQLSSPFAFSNEWFIPQDPLAERNTYTWQLATIAKLDPNILPSSKSDISERTGSETTEEASQAPAETHYITVWGSLTFTELHEQTYRYTAHLLREDTRYGDHDVDDGLQVAYLKLWQRLQTEPTLLVDRNIAWIGKFLFYSAVHTRQKEQRTSKHQVEAPQGESEPNSFVGSMTSTTKVARPHSYETRQADKRIDLHAAIVASASHILAQPSGIEQDRALWALYAITALHIQVTAASRLFGVHHRAMKHAYEQVNSLLQQHLQGYAPIHETRPIRARPQEPHPYEDLCVIRQRNANIEPEYFDKVQKDLEQQCPDTIDRDLVALQGIRDSITAKKQSQIYGFSYSSMQRAYERIHLLLASQKDGTIKPRRPQKIYAKPFIFHPDYEPMIQLLANELLTQSNSQGKLLALYSYLCNIPNRTTARNFDMSEATLRNYRNNIQDRLASLIDAIPADNSR